MNRRFAVFSGPRDILLGRATRTTETLKRWNIERLGILSTHGIDSSSDQFFLCIFLES